METVRNLELWKIFWRVKYVQNFSCQIEMGWIMIWLNALAHHLHTTALSFTVFWAQAEIIWQRFKGLFFWISSSHDMSSPPLILQNVVPPPHVFSIFLANLYHMISDWPYWTFQKSKKKHRVSKYFYTYINCILDDVNYYTQINTLRFVFI